MLLELLFKVVTSVLWLEQWLRPEGFLLFGGPRSLYIRHMQILFPCRESGVSGASRLFQPLPRFDFKLSNPLFELVYLPSVVLDKFPKRIALSADLLRNLRLQSFQLFLPRIGALLAKAFLTHVVFEGALNLLISSVLKHTNLLLHFGEQSLFRCLKLGLFHAEAHLIFYFVQMMLDFGKPIIQGRFQLHGVELLLGGVVAHDCACLLEKLQVVGYLVHLQ